MGEFHFVVSRCDVDGTIIGVGVSARAADKDAALHPCPICALEAEFERKLGLRRGELRPRQNLHHEEKRHE